eukprot:CAMPEP_0117423498 /NCGR_PEP_ID=MMETSP0758-20121206/4109_1 /TAXON_ID=63605 /ORGANISM="Percolomonas cosmopolitus, Strain AE-1 (ATCC 50343)" /LENGTH=936 /DNA_ID=CAMNT_0005206721 /DNA_START=957 /DNA_END=3767 /DNA_ORIENTATION=-
MYNTMGHLYQPPHLNSNVFQSDFVYGPKPNQLMQHQSFNAFSNQPNNLLGEVKNNPLLSYQDKNLSTQPSSTNTYQRMSQQQTLNNSSSSSSYDSQASSSVGSTRFNDSPQPTFIESPHQEVEIIIKGGDSKRPRPTISSINTNREPTLTIQTEGKVNSVSNSFIDKRSPMETSDAPHHSFQHTPSKKRPHSVPNSPAAISNNKSSKHWQSSSSNTSISTASKNNKKKSRHGRSLSGSASARRAPGVSHIDPLNAISDLMGKFKKRTKDYPLKECLNWVERNPLMAELSVKDQIYLTLGDAAKKGQLIEEARMYYSKAQQLNPYNATVWLDRARLEEEHGTNAASFLLDGLSYCKKNEQLIIRLLKLYEKQHLHELVRSQVLPRIHAGLSWRVMFEGAMFESRCGEHERARAAFAHLMSLPQKHSQVFLEAARLELRRECYDSTIKTALAGLAHNNRYGNLWFCLFLALEKTQQFERLDAEVKRSLPLIATEQLWKVHYERALIAERQSDYKTMVHQFGLAYGSAVENLRWKVFLAGARAHLFVGEYHISKHLLNLAQKSVPPKNRALVYIESARTEEFVGHLSRARTILARAKEETPNEWKVFLESILLEMRAGDLDRARLEAATALSIHPRTGRLWAVSIQLYAHDVEEQLKKFNEAHHLVPKSGEVWCEGARIHLNPLSGHFSLKTARKCLKYAIQFTPQYGDSFIEYLRLQLVEEACTSSHSVLERDCMNSDPNYGPLWFQCKQSSIDSTRQVLRHAKSLLISELQQFRGVYQRAIVSQSSLKFHLLHAQKPTTFPSRLPHPSLPSFSQWVSKVASSTSSSSSSSKPTHSTSSSSSVISSSDSLLNDIIDDDDDVDVHAVDILPPSSASSTFDFPSVDQPVSFLPSLYPDDGRIEYPNRLSSAMFASALHLSFSHDDLDLKRKRIFGSDLSV